MPAMGDLREKPSRTSAQPSKMSAALLHRPRSLAPRPAWRKADLAIAGSFAALLAPSWLLPERTWAALCHGVARTPGLIDGSTLERTIAGIETAIGPLGPGVAARIARDLQAAIYELRMQNLRAWRPGGWEPSIELVGEDRLLRSLARGRGAILWVAHFAFNSNITKIALHRHGYRVSHLSRPEHGFSKTRFGIGFLNPVRCIPEDKHLAQRIVYDRRAPSIAMRRMLQALRQGGVVSITAGAWEGSDLAEAPLFDGRLSVAVGAPRLAAHAEADVLPVFSVRDPARGFQTIIEPPLTVDPALPRDEACLAAAAEYLRRHEPWIRRFPEQWRGWKEWTRP
jgi:lauroyl/myristoyl acyltransferase